MNTFEEWKNLIKNVNNAYIYGAGTVGKKIAALLSYSGKETCLLGYIVSSKDNNPNEINGINVFSLEDTLRKDIPVLVSLSEVYHPDIFTNLKEFGFEFILPVHKYYSIDFESDNNVDIEFEKIINAEVDISEDLNGYRKDFIRKYYSSNRSFGGGCFYQSFPTLGINGSRDTTLRIGQYGILKYISKSSKILDIGCNIGFLDLELSDKVGYILGLEYSDSLAKLANELANKLNKNNIDFISGDYNEWRKNNAEKFDVVFSFAVHSWLNVTPADYADQIYNMLNDGGILIFESQQLSTDKLFETFVNAFLDKQMQEIDSNIIKDDGVTDRKFVVLRKRL